MHLCFNTPGWNDWINSWCIYKVKTELFLRPNQSNQAYWSREMFNTCRTEKYPVSVKLSCSSAFSSYSTYWFYKQTGLGFHSQLNVSRNISGQYLILILMFPEFQTRSKFRDSSTRQTVIMNGWPVIRFSPERCLSALSLNTVLIHSFSLGTPASDQSPKHKNLLSTSTGRQPLVVLVRKSYWFGCNVQFTPLDSTTFSTGNF